MSASDLSLVLLFAKVLVFLFLHLLLLPTSQGRQDEALPPFLVVAKRLLAREGVEKGRDRVRVCVRVCTYVCMHELTHVYVCVCLF